MGWFSTRVSAGKTYDICSLSEPSSAYAKPDYKLFRSVCPSWDNTARKKSRGTIFCNGSPSIYQNWLKNAVQETISTFPESDERLIFINAWNEWAEGLISNRIRSSVMLGLMQRVGPWWGDKGLAISRISTYW